MDCWKGGLIILRHNEIRGDMAAQVWSQVIKEPVVREADVSTGDDGLHFMWGHKGCMATSCGRHYLFGIEVIDMT